METKQLVMNKVNPNVVQEPTELYFTVQSVSQKH